jgi:hypothetical protein
MANRDNGNLIARIFCPICLVVSPIGAIFFLYLAIMPNDLKSPLEIIPPVAMCVGGFFASLWYCRNRMGWFQKRQ